jgi:hypothetical protein
VLEGINYHFLFSFKLKDYRIAIICSHLFKGITMQSMGFTVPATSSPAFNPSRIDAVDSQSSQVVSTQHTPSRLNQENLGKAGGGTGMHALNPMKYLPKVSTLGLGLVAAVGVGAGLLIRDAVGSQVWLGAIKDGFIHAGMEIKIFFTQTAPALSSTAAISAYMGIGAFIATMINLGTFAHGVTYANQTFGDQAWRGVKTILSGAAAGAGWGAMAGTLGAGAGAAPGAILGASIGAGIGLAQAIIMFMNVNRQGIRG